MKISIVIPAYNEALRLPASIRAVSEYIKNKTLEVEVLLIIEKSSDPCLEIAREEAKIDSRIQVIDNLVHKGKGYAVKSGVLKACGDIIFFMDADLSTHLSEIEHFIDFFKNNPKTDVLIGTRAHPNSKLVRQNIVRQSMGKVFNFFVQAFGVRDIKDTQCGFKAFRNPIAKILFSKQKINGFSFDVEILLLAQKMKLKIDQLPVIWVNSTDSKVRIVRDSIKMLWELFKIRINLSFKSKKYFEVMEQKLL